MYKLLIVLPILALAACDSTSEPTAAASSSCFWQGPYQKANPETNRAYPDTAANYWSARYSLPAGAKLELQAQFPYARYMSFNTYNERAEPVDVLRDNNIVAASGSSNPFIEGNSRRATKRDYRIELAAGARPANAAANSLYDFSANTKATLLYRIYIADQGKDEQGGVPLPEVVLTTAAGERLTGAKACAALAVEDKYIAPPMLPVELYKKARAAGNPAANPPTWKAPRTPQFAVQCNFLCNCSDAPARKVAWFANLDNDYISSFIDKSIKPIVVTRGRIPTTVASYADVEYFSASNAQLRYWSMCSNEYYSQKVQACLYDEQVPINSDGQYTIVTSSAASRPSNANKKCGVAYLEWPENGDGFAINANQTDNKDAGLLIMRHMTPLHGFSKTISNSQIYGDEAEVLQEFLPVSKYYTKAEFEALGCTDIGAKF